MLKASLQLRLGQQLTMTPQLQQAIRLLQLPSLELQAHIRELLESNVMLEAEDFMRLFTALNVARFRACRLTAWRARRIVDLWMTGIANSCTREASLYHMPYKIVKVSR